MEQNMITIRNLSKEFKGQNVLKNITMEIPKNCVYGLLGANGAKKIFQKHILTVIPILRFRMMS